MCVPIYRLSKFFSSSIPKPHQAKLCRPKSSSLRKKIFTFSPKYSDFSSEQGKTFVGLLVVGWKFRHLPKNSLLTPDNGSFDKLWHSIFCLMLNSSLPYLDSRSLCLSPCCILLCRHVLLRIDIFSPTLCYP